MSEHAADQHRAVRASAGAIDRRDRDVLALRGADRVDFLHRMVTQDVRGTPEGDGGYAALLGPNGRMIADLRFHLRPDRLLLDLAPGLGTPVREALDRYVIADDVAVEAAPEGVLGLHGPRAPEILARVAGRDVADEPRRATELTIAGAPVVAAGTRELAERGYDLFVPRDAGDAVLAALVEAGAVAFGPEAFESLRIEAGTPRWGPDVDAATIPNDAIEASAVSFTKGCYPGQEIVVRIRSRGFPARRLLGLLIEGDRPPPEGAEIRHGGVKAGRITSAVLGPNAGRVVALGYVTRRFFDETDGFSVILPDGAVPSARIVPVPFAGGSRTP